MMRWFVLAVALLGACDGMWPASPVDYAEAQAARNTAAPACRDFARQRTYFTVECPRSDQDIDLRDSKFIVCRCRYAPGGSK